MGLKLVIRYQIIQWTLFWTIYSISIILLSKSFENIIFYGAENDELQTRGN